MNCFQCTHFAITWNRRTPYSCSAWGIQSKQYPHVLVHTCSGHPCQLFREREAKTANEKATEGNNRAAPTQIDKRI